MLSKSPDCSTRSLEHIHELSTRTGEQLRRVEIDIINRAIAAADGDRRLAAQRLGISLSSLYRKLGEPD